MPTQPGGGVLGDTISASSFENISGMQLSWAITMQISRVKSGNQREGAGRREIGREEAGREGGRGMGEGRKEWGRREVGRREVGREGIRAKPGNQLV